MTRILDSHPNVFRVHPVDEFGLLIDAEAYYRAFYRAALKAEQHILLSGWQFDSEVELLRGAEAERSDGPVKLLKFLDWLCERKPSLQIHMLAWDFSLVFAAEREWMQRAVFHWSTNERLRFRFDDNHVERGCHHQKFAVIDGELAFVGGLDLCDARWDDRAHRQKNPLRLQVDGEPGKPFHDIQAYVRSRELSQSLTELFLCRWERAEGKPFDPTTSGAAHVPVQDDERVPIQAARVAISRTDPNGAPGGPTPCREILALHRAAIASAERSIYVETQYFSSREVQDAMVERMRDASRSKLEIVLVLNKRGETLKEQAAVGLAQAQVIDTLRKVAKETGHALGMYYTLPACDDDERPEQATYIHSKLMIVDDRLLTVGSANLTNRSMNVDTELNLTVEIERDGDALSRSLRALRATLLGEHSGGDDIDMVEGLVAHLDGIADEGERGSGARACRLRRHPSPTENERTALALVDPQSLPFDPAEVEEFDEEQHHNFLGGLGQTFRNLFSSKKDKG
jgi:phospholipase D1/2